MASRKYDPSPRGPEDEPTGERAEKPPAESDRGRKHDHTRERDGDRKAPQAHDRPEAPEVDPTDPRIFHGK